MMAEVLLELDGVTKWFGPVKANTDISMKVHRGEIIALLGERIRQAGAIGILVTHSLEAAATADRVLHLTAEGLHA